MATAGEHSARIVISPEECAERFPDDPEIGDEVRLLRWIPRNKEHYDAQLGRHRPDSSSFTDRHGDPMSVFRSDIMDADEQERRAVVTRFAGHLLVFLTAGEVRIRQQTVHSDPQIGLRSHAVVCGPKTPRIRRAWAQAAQWIDVADLA